MIAIFDKDIKLQKIDLGLKKEHPHQNHLDRLFKNINELQELPKTAENAPKIAQLCAKIDGACKPNNIYAKTAKPNFKTAFYTGILQYTQIYHKILTKGGNHVSN